MPCVIYARTVYQGCLQNMIGASLEPCVVGLHFRVRINLGTVLTLQARAGAVFSE